MITTWCVILPCLVPSFDWKSWGVLFVECYPHICIVQSAFDGWRGLYHVGNLFYPEHFPVLILGWINLEAHIIVLKSFCWGRFKQMAIGSTGMPSYITAMISKKIGEDSTQRQTHSMLEWPTVLYWIMMCFHWFG